MISVQTTGPQNGGVLIEIFSSWTKIQIYNSNCTSIKTNLLRDSKNLESPLQK